MDPQEKWLSARRRLWRRRWMRVRALRVGYWFFKEHPSPLPPSLLPLLDGGPPWRQAEWLRPHERGSISSPLLISKAHYFVLRLAVSQSSSRALSRPAAASFLPLPTPRPPPPSLAFYRDHNLLWRVFRVLFCQGQSGLSNKCSRWSGGGLAPATPSFPAP